MIRTCILLTCLIISPLLRLPLSATPSTTTVHWIAGGGLGEGSSAKTVSILPRAVWAADDGGLLIADELFNRIRRVDSNGRITSVAGNGGYGLGGEGLPALAAQLGIVDDLATDGEGRLFFVDLASGSIRFIDAAGSIRTFVTPQAPLFDAEAATFAPTSIVFDSASRLHVADRGAHTIWQIDPDGAGRRAAGNGERGFSGDGGPSAWARLADPRAVAAGGGAIWIADTGNRRIRLVSPEGIISTIAGDGTEQRPLVSGDADPLSISLKPIDLLVDAQLHLYVLDELGGQLLRIDGIDPEAPVPTAGSRVSVIARFEQGTRLSGLAANEEGHIFVADYSGRRVLQIDSVVGTTPTILAGNGTIRSSGDGGDARNASLYQPTRSAVSRDGEIYFVDSGNRAVRRIDRSGRITTVDLPTSVGENDVNPTGVAVGDDGLYVSTAAPPQVLHLTSDGRWAEPVLTSAQVQAPQGMVLDGSGGLLVADAARRVVVRVADGDSRIVAGNGLAALPGDGGPALQSTLLKPVDVDVDTEGAWIVDEGAHTLFRLTPDGLLQRWAGTGRAGRGPHGAQARTAALNHPTGVAADGLGGAWVADSGNRRLVHVDAGGVLRVMEPLEGIERPAGVTRLPTGDLLVSDDVAHRLIRLRHEFEAAPLDQRLRLADGAVSSRVISALRLPNVQQVFTTSDETHQVLVRHGEGVSAVSPEGRLTTVLDTDPGGALAALEISELGPVVARVSSQRLERSKPVALIRTASSDAGQTFDLDDVFGGAEAIAADADGDLYFYRDDGTILRLGAEGVMNVPGYATWTGTRTVGEGALQVWAHVTPDAVALAAHGAGTVVAAAANGDVWRLQDTDHDGRVDDRQLLVRLDARPTGIAIWQGQVYATTAGELYRLSPGKVDLVIEGFAPRILGLAAAPGRLLLVEGSSMETRLIEVTSASPRLRIWPAVVDFGASALGQSVTRTVMLRNEGERPLQLAPLAGAFVEPLDLPPGATRRLELSRAATTPGLNTGQIIWRDVEGEQLLVTPTRVHGLAPRLRWDDIDFGMVWVGAPSRRMLTLHNDGDAPLMVRAIESVDGEGAFRIDAQLPAQLAPGDSLSVPVVFVPRTAGQAETRWRIHSDDPETSQTVVSTTGQGGQALLQIDATEDEIQLGSVPLGSRVRHRLTLRNEGEMDLRIGRILAGTQRLVITPRQLTVPAGGGEETLIIDFQPLQHGPLTGTLRLFTDDPSRPQRLIRYRGFGVTRQIELSTTSVDFGTTPWATTTRRVVSVTNHTAATLRILSARADRREFRVLQRPASIAPGATGQFTVGYRPSDEGDVNGTLTIATDAQQGTSLTVSLRGRPRSIAAMDLDLPAGPQPLWPTETFDVPVRVTGARGLRGLVLQLDGVPAPYDLKDAIVPGGSLLHLGDPPLIIRTRERSADRIGLSVAGEGAATGDGIAMILRFGLRAPGPARGTQAGADRSTGGDLPGGDLPAGTELVAVDEPGVLATTGFDVFAEGRSAAGFVDTLRVETPVWPQVIRRGDLDGDGALGIDDVFLLVDAFSTRSRVPFAAADLDGDGQLTRSDVELLIEHLPVQAAGRAVALLENVPGRLSLAEPHPNPFNAETVFVVNIPTATHLRLEIYNALGQRVRTLVSGTLEAGRHRLVWNGSNDAGQPLVTGAYFAMMTSEVGRRSVKRLLLLR